MTDQRSALDTLWSLWTELGIPGTVHAHAHVAVDPEPLALYSPWLVRRLHDPRLDELIFSWLTQHGNELGPRRLRGLLGTMAPAARADWQDVATELVNAWDVRLPGAAERSDLRETSRETRRIPLRSERPSMVWIRARRTFGTGSRADLACALLVSAGEPVDATELSWLGYSRRALDDTLNDWVDAGLVSSFDASRARRYTLSQPEALRELLAAEDLEWLDARAMVEFLAALVELQEQQEQPEIVRRVAAATLRDRIQPLADRKRLVLPRLKGETDAYERMLSFLDLAWRQEDPAQRHALQPPGRESR